MTKKVLILFVTVILSLAASQAWSGGYLGPGAMSYGQHFYLEKAGLASDMRVSDSHGQPLSSHYREGYVAVLVQVPYGFGNQPKAYIGTPGEGGDRFYDLSGIGSWFFVLENISLERLERETGSWKDGNQDYKTWDFLFSHGVGFVNPKENVEYLPEMDRPLFPREVKRSQKREVHEKFFKLRGKSLPFCFVR